MMKNLFFILFFFCFCLPVFAQSRQDSLSGLWYSFDSSRIYRLYHAPNGYAADLYSSKRPGDVEGRVILNDVAYYPGKGDYEGYIYASNGIQSTKAKIKVGENEKTLILKLPRLLFFPVYIKWYKVQ